MLVDVDDRLGVRVGGEDDDSTFLLASIHHRRDIGNGRRRRGGGREACQTSVCDNAFKRLRIRNLSFFILTIFSLNNKLSKETL